MNGTERRQEILKRIQQSSSPVSGTELAKTFHVSRQVIVQDIALLRANDDNILSTNKGYFYNCTARASRTFHVYHKDNDILDELTTIIDFGGNIVDVFVSHEVYGQLRAELNIHTRKKAIDFANNIKNGNSIPLNNITSGYHYHTVTADSEQTLDQIEEELRKKQYLVP
ncbi:MAG: transcription repressor NadR [Clostridiales bacterium]|nr:transcription repressor NadR [Clostridiales bacterium]